LASNAGALSSLSPRLKDLGFVKRAGGIFTSELAPGVLGWLGLNRATKHRPPGEVEINPVIGVLHQQVERVVAETLGEKVHPYQPPTVSSPLGYLTPEARYRAWIFTPASAEGVAEDLAQTVRAHALPFMQSTVALPDLCRRLDEGLGFHHQIAYRRPVAWLLAGQPAHAAELLGELVARLGDRSDPAAVEFRRFAEILRGQLTS
jgi:hypothetical protein